MSQNPRTVAEICSVSDLGDEAKLLFREGLGPREYLGLLIENGHFSDAIRFLAHALPKREAVWWAWVSARRAAGSTPPVVIKDALDATERWIAQPTDENRRAVFNSAQQAGVATPAGTAGMAAFLSGGSLGPAEGPAVPPDPHLSAKVVAGAVLLASVMGDPLEAAGRLRAGVDQGLDVVNRINLW